MSKLIKEASIRHFEQARQYIPGGIQSNYRKDANYLPTYMSHGRDARLFDIDGNEYIDYSLSYGPSILGHSNEALRRAVATQAKKMYSNELNVLELEAAKKIVQHVPCAELVRFACSGTEANFNALRVARAHTGRNMVVRFNGHYNGSLDSLIGGVVNDPGHPVPSDGEREDDLFSQMGNTQGRAAHAFDDSYMIEWNDLPALATLLAKHGAGIAAVYMEPVMVNMHGCMPEPGYLEGVRQLCDRYGVVLIFDEVITGFRIGLGGAQAYFGVTPDLCTFAKALGGGFPVSAFCGKREIMDAITRTDVIAAGTYNGHPLAMAAVVATIEELERDNGAVYARMYRLGNQLAAGLRELFARHEPRFILQGFPTCWTLGWSESGRIRNQSDALGDGLLNVLAFSKLLNQQGILAQTRFCLSAAHVAADIKETLRRAEAALKEFVAGRS